MDPKEGDTRKCKHCGREFQILDVNGVRRKRLYCVRPNCQRSRARIEVKWRKKVRDEKS